GFPSAPLLGKIFRAYTRHPIRAPSATQEALVVLLVRVGLTRRLGLSSLGPDGLVLLTRLGEQLLHVSGCLWDGIVHEAQGRREADAELIAHDLSELALRTLQRGGSQRNIRLVVDGCATHGVEHTGVVQVAGHPGVRDGHVLQAWVLDLPLDSDGDDLLDALGHARSASTISHDVALLFGRGLHGPTG